jgi:flavorubredoxin
MPLTKITDNICSVGVLNPNLRVFDIVMKTDYGTSYNSYVVKGENKTALIDASHNTFFDIYLENLMSACNIEDLDYIVLNHNEPDHTGVIERLIDLCPKAEIVTSQAGSIYIKQIANRCDLKIKIIKDGDTLDLGGRTLKFTIAPFLHWPDSMFTWVEQDKVLFSCDFLGCHYCEPYMLDNKIVYPDKYKDAVRTYFAAIFSPFKPYVLAGLEKMKDLDIDFCCTSHGPILTKDGMLDWARKIYLEWSTTTDRTSRQIPVLYCSAYGYTKALAKAIAQGIAEQIPTAKVELFDIIEYDILSLQHKLNDSDAFCIGSPTINRDAVPPIWELLSHVDAISSQKKAALVFGSFGWSGEAVPNISSRLAGLRIKVFPEMLKVQFSPTNYDLLRARELGTEFAKSL